jgi:hypothetical protein
VEATAVKVLIFGTVYCDTEEKRSLAGQWGALHRALNPGCDLLLVDSKSPLAIHGVPTLQLGDNIGHLARAGQDGWGRAFCAGLRYAIVNEYDYVVHVEGDSLFRLSAHTFCGFMRDQDLPTFVCGINGTRYEEFAWVETGIMFFETHYLRSHHFIERYNWTDGKAKRYPNTPEAVIWKMLSEDNALNMVPIRVMRDDKGILTPDNLGEYDWISHTTPDIYNRFVISAMVAA